VRLRTATWARLRGARELYPGYRIKTTYHIWRFATPLTGENVRAALADHVLAEVSLGRHLLNPEQLAGGHQL
jgi:hypothetical protein